MIIGYDASNLKSFAQVVPGGYQGLKREAVDVLIKTIISIRFKSLLLQLWIYISPNLYLPIKHCYFIIDFVEIQETFRN